ncbi:MAG: LEPR-XLL domain-containing protein, partial [Actinomycetota bacterium]|nr:LEPR-XLL domain-containing protein [Actinomycetota bacterium]
MPTRPDPKLEPLEPRILLSADIGLVPEEGIALAALTPELVAPQVEIHDDVLVRESSTPDPEARTPRDLSAEHAAADAEQSADATAVASDEEGAPTGGGESGAEADEQGDPGRADEALSALVWSEAGPAEDLAAREVEDIAQLVVVDGRVPEVDSLLASLLESTADLDAASDANTADS